MGQDMYAVIDGSRLPSVTSILSGYPKSEEDKASL